MSDCGYQISGRDIKYSRMPKEAEYVNMKAFLTDLA